VIGNKIRASTGKMKSRKVKAGKEAKFDGNIQSHTRYHSKVVVWILGDPATTVPQFIETTMNSIKL